MDSLKSWLNYHHLYYFYVIATEGSIATASRKLRIGQPALSIQLKNFEQSLGKELFDRKKQRLHLTEAGKVCLSYAEQIFHLGDEMLANLNERLQNNKVQVEVGALDSVPKSLLQKLILQAYKVQPCAVAVLEGRGEELLKQLQGYQIDLLLSNYPPPVEAAGIHSRSVGKSPVIVCASPDFIPLRKKYPNSLEGQPFIFPTPHSRLRRDLETYFATNNIRVDIVAETQDTSLQILLGEKGVGLIALGKVAAEPLLREKKLISLGTLEGVYEEYWLMAAERKLNNPIASELLEQFKI